jgi:outer membrane protein TolC
MFLMTTGIAVLGARGSVDAQPDRALTLETAEQRALSASPRIRSAVAQLEAARSYRAYARVPVVLNPVVSMRAMIGRPDAPAATYSALVGIPFDVSGKRRAWSKEANSVIAQAQANLEVARNDVRAQAREAFVVVASGWATKRVADESAQNAADVLKRVQARFDANAATLLDLALAEREYGEARADVARAERGLLEAQASLRQTLDLAPSTRVEVAPLTLPQVPEGFSLESAVKRALARRREMAALEKGIERLRHSDQRLRKEAIGPMMLAAEGEAQGNQNTQSTAGASMSFELPIIWRNQGARAVAKGEAAALAVERELTAHAVARQAALAFESLEAALAEFRAIDEQASGAADRALEMTNEMLEAGAVDYFYLLTARRSAFELRARRVTSLREAWLARIALERAVGGLAEPSQGPSYTPEKDERTP